MTKSTESELNALHGAVAKVLVAQITETATFTDDKGEEHILQTASPATISAAIKFLKDNDITTSIEDDSNMSDLAEALKAKRENRVKLTSVN